MLAQANRKAAWGGSVLQYIRKLQDIPGFSDIPLPGHSISRTVNKVLIDPVTGSQKLMLLWAKHEPGSVTLPHTHDVEQAYYILSGKLKVTIEGQESVVEANSSILFPAGVEHGFVAQGTEPTSFLIVFAPPVDTFTHKPH